MSTICMLNTYVKRALFVAPEADAAPARRSALYSTVMTRVEGYFVVGRTSRLRPQATVVPAPLASAVAIVCPRDPKTET